MKKLKSEHDSKHCFFCGQILPEWLPAAEAARKTIYYKKGELIFSEGEEVKGMFFVLSGSVKVHKHWTSDKELIVRFAGSGDIVGHRGIGGDSFYPVSATALEPVSVCYVDLNFFMASLKVNHQFLMDLMLFFAAELKLSERKMRNLAHMPVKGRIAQALVSIKNKFGTDKDGFINLTLSRQDFASFVGTTYETSFRLMAEMEAEKIIRMSGKQMAILNETALHELIDTA